MHYLNKVCLTVGATHKEILKYLTFRSVFGMNPVLNLHRVLSSTKLEMTIYL